MVAIIRVYDRREALHLMQVCQTLHNKVSDQGIQRKLLVRKRENARQRARLVVH